MSTQSTTITTEDLILQTDASGAPIRLEYVRGRLKVEASPASRHQMTVDRIRESLTPTLSAGGCSCHSLADTLIRFGDPDRSLKRPDIAIFCDAPPESDEAIATLPAAVIEILSLGYEEKDLGDDGAPFYLDSGVLDVLVVDPRAKSVRHYQHGQALRILHTPVVIALTCGCGVTV